MLQTKPSFFGRYGLKILVAAAFLVPFVGLGSLRALWSNRNDVKSWLPEEYEETTTFKWYWSRFEGDAFIMASWDGCQVGSKKLAQVVNALRKQSDADEKEGRPRLFRKITTGNELLNRLVDDQDLAPEAAVDRLRESVIGKDGKQTCILLTISNDEIEKWDLRHQQGKRRSIFHVAVQRVYKTAERFGISEDELHLGGPPVDNVSIDVEGERSMVMLAGVCVVLGLILSWWTLRSWRFTIIVSTTAALSGGLSLAMVWFTGTPMNAILMTMPALVFVAAASGAIHLSNYYRDAVAHGTVAGAADRAVQHAWLPLALATGTTGVGLASLAISELVPIQLFGIYSALGVVGSFIVLCTYMPSLMELWQPSAKDKLASTDSSEGSLWSTIGVPIGQWIIRRNGLVTAACLAVLAVGLYGVTKVETSVKLMRLFSPEAKIRQDYAWLEQHLGPLVPVEVIVRVNRDKLDQGKVHLDLMEQMRLTDEIRRDIEKMDEVGSALAAPVFAPPIPEYASPLKRTTWNKMLERNREALHDYWCKDRGEELWRISARVSALDDDLDYGQFVDRVRGVVEPRLKFYRDNGVEGVTAVYTGIIPLVDKAQHSLFDGLLFGFAGDLALIFVAIILLMRNWSAGPLLMLPSVFPLVFVFGAMGLLGIVVDTGTVMAPAVALGVTVDDAIHFMLWCRRGQEKGMNRRDAIMFAYGDCAQPIYQSWAVIGLGLSAFAFSAFMPTRRFGILMFTMLTVSSIGNLVFLPALLAGPAGRWFWRIRKPKSESESKPFGLSLSDEEADRHPPLIKHRLPGNAARVG
ncbi:MAG TPA: MMPL family transporter [Thermoguttaceae bacterium]|nr:MMPL family transporter [Thermoguttaceae bacterium]